MPVSSDTMRARVGSSLCLLLGIAILGFCVRDVWRTERFLMFARRGEGVIAVASPHPTIRFSTAEHRVVLFVQNGFVTGPVGRPVPVAYADADPAGTARVVTFWTTWGLALWLMPAGLGALIAGLAGLVPRVRPGRF